MSDLAVLPKPRSSFRAFLLRLGVWRGAAVVTAFSVLTSFGLTSLTLMLVDVPYSRMVIWWAVSIAVPLVVASVVGVVMMRMLIELDTAHRQMENMATTDGLTHIYNRRFFMAQAEASFDEAQRMGVPLSVMMVDADHFKLINDRHGHAFGDEVLQHIALAARENVRQGDFLARYGGEEFVLLLPRSSASEAMEVASRVRAGVASLRLNSPLGETVPVTVSIGTACRSAQTPTLASLLRQADDALYRAKAAGRNRAHLA